MLGQDGRAGTGWVAGVAVLLAGVLISAVGIAALRTDTASADTVLLRGAGAVLELSDGSSRSAREGERVPRGATVLAGRTGAVLQTRDREVHLGGQTGVTVLDGVRQVLRSGFVIVDASDAPGLELQTGAGTVTAADDSLVRVDGGSLLRVGVLRGATAQVRAAGRQATADVPTWFQVQVPTGNLPGEATPFVLTPGDAYERALAADLVRADDDLNALAARLDSEGPTGTVVLSALSEEVPEEDPTTAGAPASERALGYLIAAASARDDGVFLRYGQVRDLRSAGGSWGVVAAIVAAPVNRVGAALGALLDPDTTPVLAGQPLDLGLVLDLGGSGSSTGSPGEPGPAPQPAPTGGGGGGGGGAPQPTPSPTPAPTDPVTPVVEEVVETVLDLISPSPAPPLLEPLQPLVSPSPLVVTVPLLDVEVPLPVVQVPPLR